MQTNPADIGAMRPSAQRSGGDSKPAPAPSEVLRFVGVDLARLVAILGMMASHVWTPLAYLEPDTVGGDVAEVVDAITGGASSALFAVLGGLSLVFATRAPARTAGARGVWLSGVTRGLMVLLIGTVLALAPTGIIVVLVYFGAALILTVPFLFARTRVIVAVAVALALFGGWVNVLVREAADAGYAGGGLSVLAIVDDPVAAGGSVLLLGSYPVITWLAYMLAGVLIARALLAARAAGAVRLTAMRLAAWGAGAAAVSIAMSTLITSMVGTVFTVAGVDDARVQAALTDSGSGSALTSDWWLQLVATPHSGTVAEIVRNVGIAVLVVGLLVALADGGRAEHSFVVWWLRATGAAPLTIYVTHVLLASASGFALMLLVQGDESPVGPVWWDAGPLAWLLHVGVALVIGLVLMLLHRRGPLETLVGFVARLVLRASTRS